MSNLSIFVLNGREEPLRGIKVEFEYISRHYNDAGTGSFFDVSEGWGGEARTDENGSVHFNNVNDGFIRKFYLNDKFAGRDAIRQKRITFNMSRREKYDGGLSGYQMRSG